MSNHKYISEFSQDGDTMACLGFSVPDAVLQAVHRGKCSLDASFGMNGAYQVWVRFTDPEMVHERFSLMEAVTMVDKYQPSRTPSPKIPESTSTLVPVLRPLTERVTLSKAEAVDRVARRKLNFHRKGKLMNIHPTDSLVYQDFRRDVKDFVARAIVVADNITPAKAMNRVLSDAPLRVGSTPCLTLDAWWASASPRQKVLLLTKNKSFQIDSKGCPSLDLINQIDNPFSPADLE